MVLATSFRRQLRRPVSRSGPPHDLACCLLVAAPPRHSARARRARSAARHGPRPTPATKHRPLSACPLASWPPPASSVESPRTLPPRCLGGEQPIPHCPSRRPGAEPPMPHRPPPGSRAAHATPRAAQEQSRPRRAACESPRRTATRPHRTARRPALAMPCAHDPTPHHPPVLLASWEQCCHARDAPTPLRPQPSTSTARPPTPAPASLRRSPRPRYGSPTPPPRVGARALDCFPDWRAEGT